MWPRKLENHREKDKVELLPYSIPHVNSMQRGKKKTESSQIGTEKKHLTKLNTLMNLKNT